MKHDYAQNDYSSQAPWYTLPLYFLSTVIAFYALLWLATAFVETAECWSNVDSTGCAVVWTP